MRSLFENKRLILLLAVLALGALTVLALSLNSVPFHGAQRFGYGDSGQVQLILPESALRDWVEIPWWKQIGAWTLLFVLVILIGSLISPELRKRLIRVFIRVAFTFWVLYYVFNKHPELLPNLSLQAATNGQAQPTGAVSVPPPVFVPPHVTPLVSYLISFGIALLLIGLVWGLNHFWSRYRAWWSDPKPLDALAAIARSSLGDLSAGVNSGDVIINCYLRMSEVVADKRKLRRYDAMTPHEFALRLEQAGLPGEAVRSLTRLFEGVRYGDHRSGPKETKEAVACLTTIMHYCGETI
ncbi:MAG TPA: DUF4129 domain-containing protein [Anaerolineales bacterium]|nr:DUF4129 domain-containing protein [Anaerolineales bacterium]